MGEFTTCANCKKLILVPPIMGFRPADKPMSIRIICSECKRNGWAK